MPQHTIRTNVVDLLLNADYSQYRSTNTLLHQDGRPFTKEERALADSATQAELQATLELGHQETAAARELDEATQAIVALLLRYLANLPAGSVARDAVAIMTSHDRTEYERLLAIAAPNGPILIPTED
ncbi:hypothetical protein ACGFX4_24785 [Kitasatospora sp. NPDC048365]|uniref:hypothetical protein n=1 Tax=Kitasatospora sp. NPDC048365 TaxID=3364050 RepID=UPI003722C552